MAPPLPIKTDFASAWPPIDSMTPAGSPGNNPGGKTYAGRRVRAAAAAAVTAGEAEAAIPAASEKGNAADNAGPTAAEIEPLVTKIGEACIEALKRGLNAGSVLPVEPTKQLADLVEKAKVASWTASTGGAPAQAPALASLTNVIAVLTEIFTALCGQAQVKKHDGDGTTPSTLSDAGGLVKSPASPVNVEIGLQLVSILLDAGAAGADVSVTHGGDGSMGDAVLQFLSHTVRNTCTEVGIMRPVRKGDSSGSMPAVVEPLKPPGPEGLCIAAALAAVLRSAHHAVAADGFAATTFACRLVPLAQRALACNAPGAADSLAALGGAAADLIAAAAGQGDKTLQALVVAELGDKSVQRVTWTTSGKGEAAGQRGGRAISRASARRNAGVSAPGAHAAMALRVVSSACLPVRLTGSAGVATARERRTAAEASAGAVATATIRRCLLACGRDSEEWVELQTLLREFLDACGDPHWASAPSLILCLTRALARVAGAPRAVEMSWTQREFAAKLLGQIASKLCCEHAAAANYAGDDDLTELRRWAVSRVPEGGRTNAKDGPGDFHHFLVDFLDVSAPPAPVLLTPLLVQAPAAVGGCSRSLRDDASDGGNLARPLDTTVIQADHPVRNISFLLCDWAAPPITECSERPSKRKGAKVRKSATKRERHGNHRAICGEVSSWACKKWITRALIQAEPRHVGKKGGRSRNAIAPCVMRLYRRFVHLAEEGPLARARVLALEALFAQVKKSPLVCVRRQAVIGLAAACTADVQLVASHCVMDTITTGLKDSSSLVRNQAVDLIGRLLGGVSGGSALPHSGGLTQQRATQLRTAVRLRLDDASSIVRRSAFRVSCDALRADDPALASCASDLLQRVRDEARHVREPVLRALERVLFVLPISGATLDNLVKLATAQGVGGDGVCELLKAHRAARDDDKFAVSMRTISSDAFERVASARGDFASPEDPSALAMVLEQVSLEFPAALHEHLPPLEAWLCVEAGGPQSSLVLAQQACRILSNTLPSWAGDTDLKSRCNTGNRLQVALPPLFDAQRSGLTRGATECLCVVSIHVTESAEALLEHFYESFEYLVETVERREPLNAAAQRLLCRHAWVLGTVLEFIDVEGTGNGASSLMIPGVSIPAVVARHLVALCLHGPPVMCSALVPCLGFILRRHHQLLQVCPGPREVFRIGLGSDTLAFQVCTAEALSSLLIAYQKVSEHGGAPSGTVDGNAPASLLAPKVSEAVQRLAQLQPDLLDVVHGSADAPALAAHAVSALQSLSQVGVLHPSSALPSILAASIAGPQQLGVATRRLLLRLVAATPQLLLNRFGAGLLEAARLLEGRCESGSLIIESWRFAAIGEACADHFEARRLRERLLEAVLLELIVFAPPASAMQTGQAEFEAQHSELVRAELILGVLVGLPYRYEYEVAHVLRVVAQFLTLRALPLLAESAATTERSSGIFGVCVASVLLHALCHHLCSPSDAERLLAAADNGGVEADRPFYQRSSTVSDFVPLLHELAAAAAATGVAGDPVALLGTLAHHVPLESRLLRGPAGRGAELPTAARGRRRRRCNAIADAAGSEADGTNTAATERPRQKRHRHVEAAGAGAPGGA